MSKALEQNNFRGRMGVRALVVVTSISLAAFGCTTNQFRTAGEPVMATPAGGSVTPSLSTTPGSAGPSIPSTMISSAEDAIPSTMISGAVDPALDAIAVLEANQAYEGRILGPAAPGDNNVPSLSQQYATGQYISPAVLANPQLTVNSSVSSGPTPAIVSGADVGGTAGSDAAALFSSGVPGTGLVSAGATVNGGARLANVGNAGTTAGTNANFGVTGLSNTTATGLTNATTPGTNIGTGTGGVVSTGVAAAPARFSNVLATPTLGTVGRLNVDNTAVARGAAARGGALTINNNGIAANTATVGTGSAVRVVTTGGRITVTNATTQGNQ